MKQDLDSNTYLELIDDQQFIEWVLFPTDSLEEYWKQRLIDDPELKKEIQSLRLIVQNLRTEKVCLSEESKSRIRNNLQRSQMMGRRRKKNLFLSMAGSAAAILLIVGGFLLLQQNLKATAEIAYQSILAKDKNGRQSDHVALIWGRHGYVEIDHANVDIVCSETGEIRIDSEIIEKSSKSHENLLVVPYGKTSSVTLSDGSRVWVNAGSRLIFPSVFEGDKREIYVEGEVYLDVVQKDQPFLVKAEKFDTRVLGTQFNISTYPDDEEHSIVLVQGSVAAGNKLSNHTHKIYPNQKYTYRVKEESTNIRQVDVERYVSWKSGFWTLKSEQVMKVLRKLERHYNVTFMYDEDELSDVRISGKLNMKNNIADILEAISITTPMRYEIIDKSVKLFF